MNLDPKAPSYRKPYRTLLRAAGRWALPVALLAMAGAMAAPESMLSHPAQAQSLFAPAPAISFVPGALGATTGAVVLFDAPFDGRAIEMLPAGTRVSVGGEVRRRGALLTKRSYWVEVGDAASPRYGFVSTRDVVVTAGSVAPLDLDGVPTASLLSPSGGAGEHGLSATALAAPMAPSALVVSARSASVPIEAAQDRIRIAWLPDTVLAYRDEIEAAAARHGVAADLLAIVILVESGGDPTALSPSGARGLMQVMPGTARDIAQRRGIVGFATADLNDPATSIDFGAWYLAQQLGAFGQANDLDWQRSVELAAAAYNGGPAHVGQHLTTGQPLFAETTRYQAWVGGMWGERGASTSSSFDSWWAAGGHRLVTAARMQVNS